MIRGLHAMFYSPEAGASDILPRQTQVPIRRHG